MERPPHSSTRATTRAIAFARATACTLALVVLGASSAAATTVGYWRMEVDDDPTAEGLSVANEIAGGSALTSAEATLDGVNLPVGVIPLGFSTNNASVAATQQGGANGINASASWYAALAVASITVEYWARTVEGTATPFQMTTGGADGIVITSPNALSVTYHVDDGGIVRQYSLLNLDNMDATWKHYAFTYDHVTGVATFFVDGVSVATFDGPDNAPLVLLPGTQVEVGVLMDYASAGQGTIDEVKLSGTALSPPGFLVPEPGTGALVSIGLVGLGWAGRRRS